MADQPELTTKCPQCSEQVSYPLAGLKPVLKLTCTNCGAEITIETPGVQTITGEELVKMLRGDSSVH